MSGTVTLCQERVNSNYQNLYNQSNTPPSWIADLLYTHLPPVCWRTEQTLADELGTTRQQTRQKPQSKTSEIERYKGSDADLSAAQLRGFAISLVTSLADQARGYQDLSLRPRVLACAADALWDADNVTARLLFHRAWEAAEKGDAEEVTLKTKDNPPPVVLALRRMSGRDLRSEVLNLAARRDRTLGEEFLAKLEDKARRETADSHNDAQPGTGGDNWSTSPDAAKRLQLAKRLLDDNQTERALEFAAPALNQVNVGSIGFLSALRAKSPEVADQRFASLLARVELDPTADANTVSGLSSFAFTPSFYVIFNADGSSRWAEEDGVSLAPPNLPAPLLKKFFEVAGGILLRPLPPPDQDFSSAGRTGKNMVIKRLLPRFDQYASETATALRAQLAPSASEPSKGIDFNTALLAKGIQQEESASDILAKMQDRLDHAKTSRERDLTYVDVAVALANQDDARAKVIADNISDSDRRSQIRQYVDLRLLQGAIQKQKVVEAVRLARAGQLTHTQRALAYVQAARLTVKSERRLALDYLQEAAEESRRANADDPDRARVLIAAAVQYVTADRVRAWEIMDEAVKAANSAADFTGERAPLSFSVASPSGINTINIGGEEFDLSRAMRLLAKEDFYRSVDLAKSFKNDAPRATATLAIARAMLEQQGVESR